MPIDPKDLGGAIAAMTKANELYVAYKMQTGALHIAATLPPTNGRS